MSNLTYTGKPEKELPTTSEQFYGSASADDNTSDGLSYMRGVDRSAVTEDDIKQGDEDYKEVNKANFDNVDMVMEGKSEEEQGIVIQQQVFSKTEQLHPEAPVSEDFVKRVQADVQDEKLEYAEDELPLNPTWNEAGKILKGFLGAGRSDTTDSDFALQLGNEMFANIGGLNVSGEGDRVTGGLLPLVSKAVASEDENVINALLYTMEMYDRKPMTTRGWVDGVGYLLGDASNYLGLGFVANATRHTVGKQVTNTAVKGMLREALAKIGQATAKHPVATEAVKQGALWSAVDEMGKEIIKARSGVRGDNQIDLTNIAGAGVAGGIVGLGIVTIPPAIWRKGSKELVDYINRSLRRESKGIRTFKRVAGEQSIIGDEAGSLPKESKNVISESTYKTVRDENFKSWFGDSKVVDELGEPLVVYHGTTHDIREFTMDRANPENWHGKGFYFSDDVEDVNRNYGTLSGADLTGRIERRAEQIAQDMDLEYDDPKVIRIAKDELSGGSPNVMPVFVQMKNPAEVSSYGGTEFEVKMFDDDGEFLDEPEGLGAELFEALGDKISEYSDESSAIMGQLQENFIEADSFTAKEFEDALRAIEEFSYIQDDEGNLINHDIISDVYSELGFDGIMLRDADEQFLNMGMNPDTTHYIVFQPNQIKSVNNSGAFSDDGDVLKSALTVSAGAGATAEIEEKEQ